MHPAMRLTASALLLFASGCNLIKGKETTGQYVDDTTLTARAKAALVHDSNVSATDFTVNVYKGNVTLTGVAKTSDEAARAVEDIKQVAGVKGVRNGTRVASADRGSSEK